MNYTPLRPLGTWISYLFTLVALSTANSYFEWVCILICLQIQPYSILYTVYSSLLFKLPYFVSKNLLVNYSVNCKYQERHTKCAKFCIKEIKKISERGQKSRQLIENRYSLLSSHVVLQISGKGKLDKAWVFPLGQLYYLTCLSVQWVW